jgi:anti-sigma factor RsiW
LAALALADGAAAALAPVEVDSHLRQCPACRAEVESLRALVSLLGRQTREIPTENLWPGVRAALASGQAGRPLWHESGVLVLLGGLLLACRLSLFAPAAPWLVVNGATILVALLAFLVLREHPLRLSVSLHLLEGENL